jgi:hypothetical protein
MFDFSTRGKKEVYRRAPMPVRPVNAVTFDQRPIRNGGTWALLAVHGLSGQREDVVGFHCAEEAIEWLGSNGCQAWLRARGYRRRPDASRGS